MIKKRPGLWRRADGPARSYTMAAVSAGAIMLGSPLATGLISVLPFALIATTLLMVSGASTLVAGHITSRGAHLLSSVAMLSAVLFRLGMDDPIMITLNCGWMVLIPMFLSSSLSPRAVAGHAVVASVLASTGVGAIDGPVSLVAVRVFTVAGLVLLPAMMFLTLRRDLDAAVGQAQALATTDSLTGLTNRRGMQERFPSLQATAARQGGQLAVLVCDLDHFKAINDTLGHAEGDAALVSVAQVLQDSARTEDLIVRLGGEELAVIAIVKSHLEAVEIAERLRLRVREHCAAWSLTVSVGVAALPGNTPGNPSALLSQLLLIGDRRVYVAKASGRDQVCGCDPTAQAPAPVTSDR